MLWVLTRHEEGEGDLRDAVRKAETIIREEGLLKAKCMQALRVGMYTSACSKNIRYECWHQYTFIKAYVNMVMDTMFTTPSHSPAISRVVIERAQS